jgi:RPM1-interacting protein 4
VPKFGQWDTNDHMPYTVVFNHAREGRGKPINPNDPQQNPGMFTGLNDGSDRKALPEDKSQPEKQQQERPHPERPTISPQGSEGIFRKQQPGRPATTTRYGDSSQTYDPTRSKSIGQNKEGKAPSPATTPRSRLPQRTRNSRGAKYDSSQNDPSMVLPNFAAWEEAQDSASGDQSTVIFDSKITKKKAGGPDKFNRTPDKAERDLHGDSNHGHSKSRSWFCCYALPKWKA